MKLGSSPDGDNHPAPNPEREVMLRHFRPRTLCALLGAIILAMALTGCGEPTVTFASPTANATISGTQVLRPNISNPAGTSTAGVQFQLDSQNLGNEDTSSPFEYSWNTTSTTNGKHTLTAIVRSTGGTNPGVVTTSITVTVSNQLDQDALLILGDSLEEQAFDEDANGSLAAGPGAPSDVTITAFRGWSTFTPQIIESVRQQVATLRPAVAGVALGSNDASPFNGGWNAQDETNLRSLLSMFHDDTAVYLVLPAYIDTPVSAELQSLILPWRTSIDQARTAIPMIAAERPNTTIVDPLPWMQAHPNLISPQDGLHLATIGDTPTMDGVIRPVVAEAAAWRRELLYGAYGVALAA